MGTKSPKTVMVFGTYDIFHQGHKNFFKQAKKYGDFLIVVIARDKTVLAVKNKLPRNREEVRLRVVAESGLADSVVLGNLRNKYAAIRKYRPDAICLGYDQGPFTEQLAEKLKTLNLAKTRIYRLKPYKPEIYKSSKLYR